MKKNLKEDILRLRSEGKSYRQITKELGCSKSTVCYYLSDGQKEKNNRRTQRNRKNGINIMKAKLMRFRDRLKRKPPRTSKRKITIRLALKDKCYDFITRNSEMSEKDFTLDEAIAFIGNEPVCYLTGDKIDLLEPKTYNFDHKIPASRGGDNSLDNLGICTKQANMSKSNMTINEYLELCKKVLEHNGYLVVEHQY